MVVVRVPLSTLDQGGCGRVLWAWFSPLCVQQLLHGPCTAHGPQGARENNWNTMNTMFRNLTLILVLSVYQWVSESLLTGNHGGAEEGLHNLYFNSFLMGWLVFFLLHTLSLTPSS